MVPISFHISKDEVEALEDEFHDFDNMFNFQNSCLLSVIKCYSSGECNFARNIQSHHQGPWQWVFSILVDESCDISIKEQMSLILRYVNKKRIIIEQFLGVVHVSSTIALLLKYAIECLLCEHNLSLSNLRGQGYDRANNMQGDINGLKTLILKRRS